MSHKNNDTYLLKNNPKELVLKYIPIIENLVAKKLIKPGFFLYQDKDDIVQEISIGLLEDISYIRKKYNGYSKFSSYFIKIITNRCCELVREEHRQETREMVKDDPDNPGFEKKKVYTKRYSFTQITDNNVPGNLNDTDKDLILESELEFLDVVIRMYPFQKVKLLICLKVLSGRQVTYEELKAYNNSCKRILYETVVDFTVQKKNHTNEDRYHILTGFFNSCDKTKKKKDALRKWINKMLIEMVCQMNRDSAVPDYNKQNIMGLIGLYFDKKVIKIPE